MLLDAEVPAVLSGEDIMFGVHFTSEPVVDYRSILKASRETHKLFEAALLEHGVFRGGGKFYVGMCHDERDVAETLDAFRGAVTTVRDAAP